MPLYNVTVSGCPFVSVLVAIASSRGTAATLLTGESDETGYDLPIVDSGADARVFTGVGPSPAIRSTAAWSSSACVGALPGSLIRGAGSAGLRSSSAAGGVSLLPKIDSRSRWYQGFSAADATSGAGAAGSTAFGATGSAAGVFTGVGPSPAIRSTAARSSSASVGILTGSTGFGVAAGAASADGASANRPVFGSLQLPALASHTGVSEMGAGRAAATSFPAARRPTSLASNPETAPALAPVTPPPRASPPAAATLDSVPAANLASLASMPIARPAPGAPTSSQIIAMFPALSAAVDGLT